MSGPSPRSKAFGAEVRAQRARLGWSQRDVCRKLGVSEENHDHVSRIERGAVSPTLDTAWRLADALGVKLADLIGRADP